MEPKNGNFRKYTSKNPLMRRVIGGFLADVVSMVELTDARSILDAGCGEGFVSSRLRDKRVTGVDISRGALSVAQKNGPGVSLACGDIYRMPFRSNSFDLVMATEVLEHLKEPEKAMIEVGRLSKRYCLFSVPNEPYFRAMDLLRGKNISRLGNDQEHINNWTKRDFLGFVSKNFNIIEVRTPFPWVIALCQKSQGS